MINVGGYGVKVLVRRLDGSNEGSLALGAVRTLRGVTEDGVEIFTRSPKGLDRPPYG